MSKMKGIKIQTHEVKIENREASSPAELNFSLLLQNFTFPCIRLAYFEYNPRSPPC